MPGPMKAGEAVTIDIQFEIPELYPGAFSFSPWIENAGKVCDAIDIAITVQMARGEGPDAERARTALEAQAASSSTNTQPRGIRLFARATTPASVFTDRSKASSAGRRSSLLSAGLWKMVAGGMGLVYLAY